MQITIKKYKRYIDKGSEIVIKNRLYTPGVSGIRTRVLEKDLESIYIAYIDDVPVGCLTIDAYLEKINKRNYKIINTFIKPDYRGLNIGQKLIKRARKDYWRPFAGFASLRGEFFYKKNGVEVIYY